MTEEERRAAKDAKDDAYREGYLDGEDNAYPVAYEKGYESGKSAGYESGFEDGIVQGHSEWGEMANDNWSDNDDLIAEIAEHIDYEATRYVVENGGWHPEEAMQIIADYGSECPEYWSYPPTAQEYQEAIDSLIAYYEYFYFREYQ